MAGSGFKKSKAFEQIRVPMEVNTASDDGQSLVKVTVAHTFRIPPPEIREEYQRKLLIIKGKKLSQGSRSEASWSLWKHCIISVEGYDDLPEMDKEGMWKLYFADDIGRIHVDNAVEMLMNAIGADEPEEVEKKSEQFLGGSS
jgi:hypothetical protein